MMRVDKFLWAIRVMKTRSRASAHCKEGKVSLCGDKLKPSKVLNIGDVVVIKKGAVNFSFKVISFPKSRVGASLVPEYAKNLTPQNQLDKHEMIRLSHMDRFNGVGRPTKRDRRNLDKAFDV